MHRAGIAFVLALASCHHDQTFAEAMTLVCSVPELAPDAPREQRLGAGFVKIRDQVTNPEVVTLMRKFGEVEDKQELLAAAVHEAGLTRCALVDAWSQGRPSSQPSQPSP